MPKYQCLISSENFKLRNERGKVARRGFYATIFVESPNVPQAELDAIEIVKNGEIKHSVMYDKADSPMLFLEEITELDSQTAIESKNGKGYTFYLEKKWWEFWKQ